MGTIIDTAATTYRDYETDGVPASGAHDPSKADIRALFATVESSIGTALLGSVSVAKATRALLNADLAHAVDTIALVYADATDANNDLYVKVGGSGAGSWTLTSALHTAIDGLTADALADIADSVTAAEAARDEAEGLAGALAGLVVDVEVGYGAVGVNYADYNGNLPSGYTTLVGYGPVVDRASLLTSVVLPIAVAGPIKIYRIKPTGGDDYQVIGAALYSGGTGGTGDRTFTDVHFGAVTLQAGETLGVFINGTTELKYMAGAAGITGHYQFGEAAGTTTWQATANQYFGGRYTVETETAQVGLEDLSPELAAQINGDSSIRRALFNPAETFEADFVGTAPDPLIWSVGAGWTTPAGGLLSPVGAGNAAQVTKFWQPVHFRDEIRDDFWFFTPQHASAIFLVGGWGGTNRSSLLRIDGAAHTVSWTVASPDGNWAAIPANSASGALAALVAGRGYMAKRIRDRRVITAEIYDLKTGAMIGTVSSGSNITTAANPAGYMDGSPFIMNVAQQTLFERFKDVSTVGRPRFMAIGDSRTAESTYGLIPAERWAELTRVALGGSVVISAMDGTVGTDAIPKHLEYELPAVLPRYLLCYYGTNDVSASDLETQILALQTWCAANDVKLGVVILPPATDRDVSAKRTMLLALPKTIRKVRFDLAMTTGNDGTTVNAALYYDPVHANAAGSAACFDRLQVDWPEVFQ